MFPLNGGFEYWSGINIFSNNVLASGNGGPGIPVPPVMNFDLLAENGDALLTEGGDNIQVEHP